VTGATVLSPTLLAAQAGQLPAVTLGMAVVFAVVGLAFVLFVTELVPVEHSAASWRWSRPACSGRANCTTGSTGA
jgi:fatty acid desaturase